MKDSQVARTGAAAAVGDAYTASFSHHIMKAREIRVGGENNDMIRQNQ